MFKVNNKDTKNYASGVVLVSLSLTWTYFTASSSVSIVDFEHVNVRWAYSDVDLHSPIQWNTGEIDYDDKFDFNLTPILH